MKRLIADICLNSWLNNSVFLGLMDLPRLLGLTMFKANHILRVFKDDRASGIERNFSLGKSEVSVGRYTYGAKGMQVKQWGEGASLTIGAFCSVAKNLTVILGGNHRIDWITTFPFGHIWADELGGSEIVGHPATKGDVKIGHDVWIGTNATIMSGVSIGNGAVIAANSTVVRSVADYEVVGGNPAKHIKFRFDKSVIAALLEIEWWDLPVAAIREIAPLLSQEPNEEVLNEIRSARARATE